MADDLERPLGQAHRRQVWWCWSVNDPFFMSATPTPDLKDSHPTCPLCGWVDNEAVDWVPSEAFRGYHVPMLTVSAWYKENQLTAEHVALIRGIAEYWQPQDGDGPEWDRYRADQEAVRRLADIIDALRLPRE